MAGPIKDPGVSQSQGFSTESPEAMRRTSIGTASYGVFTGIDETPKGGASGPADARSDILSGESFPEQAPNAAAGRGESWSTEDRQ